MRRAAIAAILLLGAWQAYAQFKVDVQLVRLLVNVKDPQGQLVGSLPKEEFKVVDSGVPQEIAVFERNTAVPLNVALMIDASASTGKDLKYELQSVEKFLDAFVKEGNPEDAAALYTFNYQVSLLTSFTRREARLKGALTGIKAEGGTSLYDAIYLACNELEGREGRHVLVVVTDGGDTTSYHKFEDSLRAAHLADAVIYPILVVPITNDAGRNTGGEHALELLATGTGGRVFKPALGKALDAAFADILKDLRTQYLVGYYPRNIPVDAPRFRPVKVSLARPDLRAQTRAGYYVMAAK